MTSEQQPQQPEPRKLTRRQRVFIEHYLECWNASEAARQSGYINRPNVAGPRLMADDSIKAAIEVRMKEKAMATDEVLARLAEQARVNIGDFITINQVERVEPEDPDNKDSNLIKVIRQELELNFDVIKARGHLVKEVGIGRFGPYIKVVDNQAALQLIGKHEKLFTENVDITSGGEPLKANDAGYDRAITALADAIREAISRPDAKQESDLAATEQAPVAGPAEQSG